MENQFAQCIESFNTTLMLINIKLDELDRRLGEIEQIVIRNEMKLAEVDVSDAEVLEMSQTLSDVTI